jgi:hypothetical protein
MIITGDMETLQIVLNRLWELVVENATVIHPTQSNSVCFLKARMAENSPHLIGPHRSGTNYLHIFIGQISK